MILAFETSTDVCSVAYQKVEGEIHEKRIQGRSVHSDHLFLFTQALMEEHEFTIDQIENVLVSNGPGSYTGLRIAASAIKGIFFDSEAEILATNTLAGFAASQLEKSGKTVHAIIDARRTHVYHQQFVINASMEAQSEMKVLEIAAFEATLNESDIIVGTGLNRLNPTNLEGIETYSTDVISAQNLIQLFNHQSESEFFEKTDLEALSPNYITSSQVNNSNI
ncbi:MAG: tRNA (adenosine(37)-N6)-threonylcarbamoyltransferase complex dimerization subunit type 1 TsaB [Balneolaceae bacterium]|nr:tRNA (adenosine(37)-N6)-threonylcarbamoyltransferase complex dimerization subunit type 1 TsaB [Balneolaceae bacterium]